MNQNAVAFSGEKIEDIRVPGIYPGCNPIIRSQNLTSLIKIKLLPRFFVLDLWFFLRFDEPVIPVFFFLVNPPCFYMLGIFGFISIDWFKGKF